MQNNLIIESITYDLQYFFTNKGIVKISIDDDGNPSSNIIEYNLKNFDLGLKILQENLQTKFDLGLIDQNDYMYSSRKFLYECMDVLRPNTQVSILNEWEVKFGKNLLLIKENTDATDLRKIFNNSWSGLQNIFKTKVIDVIEEQKQDFWGNVWSGTKSLLSWGWDNIKKTISKAFTCAKGSDYIDCFMEGLRTIATSLLGVLVLTSVSFVPGVGSIPNFIIFGALLIYDIYKMQTGKEYKVSDIVVDIVSLLTPWLAGKIGGMLKGVSSFFGLGKIAGAGYLGTFIKSLSKGIGSLANFIGKTVTFFSVKLGIKWLSDMSSYSTSGLKKITSEIDKGQKAAQKDKDTGKVDKSKKTKSTKTSDEIVPVGWENYPCVTKSLNVKQRKTKDDVVVYEGGGYIWFSDGRKYDPKTKEVSTYECDDQGKVVSGDIIKLSDYQTTKVLECDNFPFELGCSNDKIKKIQQCFNLETDGMFSKELQNKLIDKGYGKIITEPIYNEIMGDCATKAEDRPLSSGGFAKDV